MGIWNKIMSVFIDPVPWIMIAAVLAIFWLSFGTAPFMYAAIFFLLGSAEMTLLTEKRFPMYQYVDIQIEDGGKWSSMLRRRSDYRFYEHNCIIGYDELAQTLESMVGSDTLAAVLRDIHEHHDVRFAVYLENERFR